VIPFVDLRAQYQSIKGEIDAAVLGVLDSCQFTLGSEVAKFEEEFAAYTSSRFAIGVNTGTSALHLALLAAGIAPGGLVNVNFPACPASEVAGIELTRQGRRNAELMRVEERRDGRGFPYYWLMAQRVPYEQKEGTDLGALAAKKISITPLRLDLTDHDSRLRLEQAFAQATQEKRRRSGEGAG